MYVSLLICCACVMHISWACELANIVHFLSFAVAPVPTSTVVPPVKANSGGDLQSQENRAYLRQLDHVTILSLLDLLGLPQYRASFASEHIDGDILVDLGIEELKDLGVTSKIHLLRLMKIIEGKTPAKKYLEEGSPYGELPVPKR